MAEESEVGRPLRILHVTECVGGGVGRAIDMIPGTAPAHEHFLLSVDPGVQRPDGEGFRRVAVLPAGHLRRVLAVRRVVSDLRPDVVHAHSSWAGFYVRAIRLPSRLVYQPHGYALELGGRVRRSVFGIAERLLAKRRSTVAVLSPHEFEVAGRLNPHSRRVFVPNVPTVRPSSSLPTERARRVVMVGRLGEQKDPDYFVALKNLVTRQDPSIVFRWIGEGEPRARAELLAADVTVTGWLSPAALVTELEGAGLYAHTSRYEGFPLSVLDAAVCGLPVLARAIAAFEGSPVAQFSTLEEHAAAIVALFSEVADASAFDERNAALLDGMNAKAQGRALALLYSSDSSARPARWMRVQR